MAVENVQPLRTSEEIGNVREALAQTNASERNLLLFNLGINTGLRIGDIVRLRIEDVRGRTSVVIREGKTRKARTVYLDAVLSDITNYLQDKDVKGWLFPSRKGDKHISTTQAYR
ncbi:MAG TPA: tyrosine-type recombinase/integrase, partial [Bacillota bacterium]